MAASVSPDRFTSIIPLLRDEQYEWLLRQIQPKKVGRPRKDMPPSKILLDNKLLLQLHLIRTEEGTALQDLQFFFVELCCNLDKTVTPSSCSNVGNFIQTCLAQLQKVKESQHSVFLEKELEMLYFGPYSLKSGISKDYLLSLSSTSSTLPPFMQFIPVMLLMEMNQFRLRKSLTIVTLVNWLRALCTEFESVNPVTLKQMLNKLRKELKVLQRRKNDSGGAENLQTFKDRSCMDWLPITSIRKTTMSSSTPSESAIAMPATSTIESTTYSSCFSPSESAIVTPATSAIESTTNSSCFSPSESSAKGSSERESISAAPCCSPREPTTATHNAPQKCCTSGDASRSFQKFANAISERVMPDVLSNQYEMESLLGQVSALQELHKENTATVAKLQANVTVLTNTIKKLRRNEKHLRRDRNEKRRECNRLKKIKMMRVDT